MYVMYVFVYVMPALVQCAYVTWCDVLCCDAMYVMYACNAM